MIQTIAGSVATVARLAEAILDDGGRSSLGDIVDRTAPHASPREVLEAIHDAMGGLKTLMDDWDRRFAEGHRLMHALAAVYADISHGIAEERRSKFGLIEGGRAGGVSTDGGSDGA